MVRLVKDNHIAFGQQEASDLGIEEEERMIDDDNLGTLGPFAHMMHIAVLEIATLRPGALIAISCHTATDIAWELKAQRLEVAVEVDPRLWIIDIVIEALKV